jgi:TRAP transporter TAXI family solute receptor
MAMASLLLAACVGGPRGDPWREDLPDTLVISSGGSTGIYHAYGTGLGEVLEERLGVPVEVRETGGSVENLQQLADGESHLAFSAVDAAQDAMTGRGSFDEPLEVRALARIYDDFVHLVVTEESGVHSVEDLRGRPVSLGAPGSGTALIAGRLLESADVAESELDVQRLGISGSISALRAGEIDAFFWSGGLRTPGLTALADEVSFRLVPLGALVDTVRLRHGSGYRHGVVPEGMYGLPADVETMAVPNVLVVHSQMPDSVAEVLVTTLFGERPMLADEVPAAALLNRTRAVFTEPVELHPGAVEYYRDTKE